MFHSLQSLVKDSSTLSLLVEKQSLFNKKAGGCSSAIIISLAVVPQHPQLRWYCMWMP